MISEFPFLESFIATVHHSGYLLLFLAVVLEGPVATLAGAALAAAGALHPVPTLLTVLLGNLSADTGWYLIGRTGGFSALANRLPGLQRTVPRIRRMLLTIKRHPCKIIISSKLWFGIAAIPALVAAGMAKVPLRLVLPLLFLCEWLWSGALFSLGYSLTTSLPWLLDHFQEITLLAAIPVIATAVMVSPRLTDKNSTNNSGA